MIDSWKKFVYALAQMREMQKTPGIEKRTELFFRLKKVEAEVDEVIDRKITEWNGRQELDIY